MPKYPNRKRKPNEANLDGLMVVNSADAYDVKNKRWKKGVYGIVSKDLPFISKTTVSRDGTKKRKFVNDVTELPNVTKERVMAFFDDKQNSKRDKCYLVERQLYDEIMATKGKK